jgi:hypothetical protein
MSVPASLSVSDCHLAAVNALLELLGDLEHAQQPLHPRGWFADRLA